MVDRQFAGPVFGTPNRLQWDVLGDTGDLLDKLLPSPRATTLP